MKFSVNRLLAIISRHEQSWKKVRALLDYLIDDNEIELQHLLATDLGFELFNSISYSFLRF